MHETWWSEEQDLNLLFTLGLNAKWIQCFIPKMAPSYLKIKLKQKPGSFQTLKNTMKKKT
jgi:hypothetical protein